MLKDLRDYTGNKPVQLLPIVSQNTPNTQKFNFACLKCGQMGHKASECVNNMGNPFLVGDKRTLILQKRVHFAKSYLEGDSDLNVIHIELEQNNLPVVLDSGASVSSISKTFMPKTKSGSKTNQCYCRISCSFQNENIRNSFIGYLHSRARF